MVGAVSGRISQCEKTHVTGWISDVNALVQVWHGKQIIDEFIPSASPIEATSQSTANFTYKISPRYLDGSRYQLDFRFKSTGQSLENSPIHVQFLYESLYTPFHTTDLTGNRVLVLAPHADDETFGCGGALALHRQQHDDVKVIILTDGSKGNIIEQGTQDYIAIRQKEARQACAILNVIDVDFWDSPDRTLSHDQTIQNRLGQLLNTYRPSLIYSPSPLEYHPDHQATAYHLWQILQTMDFDCRVAFWGTNRPLKNNTLVDISAVVEQKRQASYIYQSQLKNHPYTDCCIGLNRYTSLPVSNQCEYAEGYVVLDAETIRDHPLQYFGDLQCKTELEGEQSELTMRLLETQKRIRDLENTNRQLVEHSGHLENEANSPRLVVGLYRALVPIKVRLWLRDRLQ